MVYWRIPRSPVNPERGPYGDPPLRIDIGVTNLMDFCLWSCSLFRVESNLHRGLED